ncbi:unnamed protein product [Larinioides sclopetarius]|uniref:Uncharacterized protein n=1 Tax=Larinioides sclopetarius TaxID=280406 RepID=A0AAV1ZG95_9ARAC
MESGFEPATLQRSYSKLNYLHFVESESVLLKGEKGCTERLMFHIQMT